MIKNNPNGEERIRVARPGFSLIELFAVIVVIGLLVAITAPSLEQARMTTRNAACLDRLRAIGVAQRAYTADDPNGWALPVHPLQFFQSSTNPSFIGAYEWGGKSGVGRSTGGNFLTSKYGTMGGFGPATRPLNSILYPHGFRDNRLPSFNSLGAERDTKLALDAFRCPSDDGPPTGAHCPEWIANQQRSSFDHFGTSYAANIFMVGSAAGGSMSSNSPYLRPLLRVPNPFRTTNYEENIGRWAWATRRETCDFFQPGVDPGPTKVVRGWHERNWTYNHAFVDGHAATVQILIDETSDAAGYANHYVVEQVFDDPELQATNRCTIIRGPGWQKDTLPADWIITGLLWGGSGRPSYEDCVENP